MEQLNKAVADGFRAALYLRLSKEDGDREESDSIQNQRELLRAHIAKYLPEVTVVAEKVDDGYSGATFQRPRFIEMMEEVRAGKINCVIVKDLSRFGRDFGESGKYIEHVFPFLGVRFIVVNDNVDTFAKKGQNDGIVVPFLNLINGAYCRDISVKIRSQLEVKRKKGDFIGAFAVYGYLRDEKNHNRLVAVFRVLRDETYTGVMVQGKCATPNHKIKKKFQKPEEDWARVHGTHDAIIPLEDFALVARLLERDTRTPPGGEGVYPFSGMGKCGVCGENMIRKTVTQNGKRYVYFVCCHGCKGVRIAKNALTEAVSAALRAHIGNIINLDRVLRFIDDLPLKQEDVQRLDGQIAARRTEIARCETLVASLYESWQSGVITKDEFTAMKARYNTLKEDAEQAVLSLSREIGDIIACGGEKSGWIAHFQQYHDFTELTRRMVITLVDSLTVHPENRLDVLFRYRYDYERAVSFAKAVCQVHTVPNFGVPAKSEDFVGKGRATERVSFSPLGGNEQSVVCDDAGVA